MKPLYDSKRVEALLRRAKEDARTAIERQEKVSALKRAKKDLKRIIEETK